MITNTGNSKKPTIVFAGGGHAHLYSLRHTRELTEQGYAVILVNPSRFLYYSGMAPGLLSRIYRPEEDRLDVRYLVEKGGGRFVQDRIKEIRSGEQKVLLDSGETIHYDAMSVCLGSGVPNKTFAMSEEHLTAVKPVENMENLHWELRGFKNAGGKQPKVLVVGGGPGGCEMACNSKKVFEDHSIDGKVTITDSNPYLLKSAPKRARDKMHEFLSNRGVEVLLNSEIVKVEENAAYTRHGRKIEFDTLILAVGIKPPEIFRESGLATSYDDGLWINEHLQSISDPRLFGGGDSVAFLGEPLTRLGVFAIRQGPLIFRNIQALLKGEPLEKFEPQSRFLYILNLGNYEGLAIWGSLVWRSKYAWNLKNYIDTKFMRQFQYPEDEPGEVKAYFDRLAAEDLEDIGVGIPSLEERTQGIASLSGDGSVSTLTRIK